jgi:hypothetical protein
MFTIFEKKIKNIYVYNFINNWLEKRLYLLLASSKPYSEINSELGKRVPKCEKSKHKNNIN